MFPNEVLEQILKKCDGKSLLNARKVDENWRNIVDYLTRKTKIWEWCCNEEIPWNELLEYMQHYKEDDTEKWLNIYINWCSWEEPNRVICDIILSPVEVPRISCIGVSRDFVAVGSEDGRLRIFTTQWKRILVNRILAVRISSLTFIESSYNCDNLVEISLVVAFSKGIQIFCFDGSTSVQHEVQDVKSHSVYKNFICYERVGGRITIAKLITLQGRKELLDIWFSRIYSPTSLSCMKMWEGVCTFLINNEVKVIEYNSMDGPMDLMKKKTIITFNCPILESRNIQILRNDIIISLSQSKSSTKLPPRLVTRISCLFETFPRCDDSYYWKLLPYLLLEDKNEEDVNCDFIEFFLLGENDQCSKKVFSTWDIFRCYITCIYLYGNTLILGMDVGNVYIYHVSSWKTLDIREYSHKMILGKHPIIGIDVKETRSERRFYVSSRFSIHEITGFLPNIY